jgi:hypothetical protein
VQISSSSLSTLPVAVNYRRDGLDDATQRPTRPVAGQSSQDPVQGEITRIRPRPSTSAQRSYNNPSEEQLQNLPQRGRSAVQAYLSNGPSVEERLGVELAGLDVFV